jgi:isoleucyl-tRNA synthetase
MTVVSSDQDYLDDLKSLEDYILIEMNISELLLTTNEGKYISVSLEADRARLGKRLRGEASAVYKGLANLTAEEINTLMKEGKLTVCGHELDMDDVKVNRAFTGNTELLEACWSAGEVVVIDLEIDQELRFKGLAREFVNRVQKARKKVILILIILIILIHLLHLLPPPPLRVALSPVTLLMCITPSPPRTGNWPAPSSARALTLQRLLGSPLSHSPSALRSALPSLRLTVPSRELTTCS